MTTNASQLMNYINGDWQPSGSEDNLSVINPATAEVIAQVPLSASSKIDEATDHAVKAFEEILPSDDQYSRTERIWIHPSIDNKSSLDDIKLYPHFPISMEFHLVP